MRRSCGARAVLRGERIEQASEIQRVSPAVRRQM
jgi:hypothetical protein